MQRLAKHYKRFRMDADGAVAIVFSLTLLVVVGFLALAIDFGSWTKKRSDLVGAADTASLAGAKALVDGVLGGGQDSAASAAELVALRYAKENGGSGATADVTVSMGSSYGVRVALSELGQQYFSKAIAQSAPDISAVSEAMANQASDACVVALDKTASPGIEFGLSGSVIANGCSIWSNADTSVSMSGKGSGMVSSDWNCAVSRAMIDNGLGITPKAQSNCLPVHDPLAGWTPPVVPLSCDATDLVIDKPGTYTLWPGKYCGGITIKGGAKVTFMAGTYFVDGGDLLIEGGGSVYGGDVSFLLSGGAAANLGGAGEVDLAAPTYGDMAGLVFASGRDEPKATSIFRGTSLFRVEGHIYLPSHHVRFSGGNDGGFPTEYTNLIAGTIKFEGSSQVEFRNNGGAGPNYGATAFSHIFLLQ